MIEIGLMLDLAIVFGLLGLAWILVNKKEGIDEQRVRDLATLMASEIARVERDELKRENDVHVENLEAEFDRKKDAMDKEVG